MGLTKAEQETIINFNEADEMAHVFTYNQRWQKHLEALGFPPWRTNNFGGKDYTLPRHMLRLPRGKKHLSPEARQKLADRGRQMARVRRQAIDSTVDSGHGEPGL